MVYKKLNFWEEYTPLQDLQNREYIHTCVSVSISAGDGNFASPKRVLMKYRTWFNQVSCQQISFISCTYLKIKLGEGTNLEEKRKMKFSVNLIFRAPEQEDQ